eukprot:RCo038698
MPWDIYANDHPNFDVDRELIDEFCGKSRWYCQFDHLQPIPCVWDGFHQTSPVAPTGWAHNLPPPPPSFPCLLSVALPPPAAIAPYIMGPHHFHCGFSKVVQSFGAQNALVQVVHSSPGFLCIHPILERICELNF